MSLYIFVVGFTCILLELLKSKSPGICCCLRWWSCPKGHMLLCQVVILSKGSYLCTVWCSVILQKTWIFI